MTLTNGTLDGTGTISTVNVGAGTGGIITNGNGTAGAALTIGTLSFGGTATVNLLSSTTSAPLVTTSLSVVGGTVTINATNALWNNGSSYNLISYGGGSIGGAGFSAFLKGTISNLGARQSATLGDSGTAITLAIAGDLPVWTGAQNGNWTTNVIGGSSNWKLQTGGTATDFLTSDTVLFDDTATGTTTVTVSTANVAPISTTFANSSLNYNLTGSFGISSGILLKTGTGSLTIANANSYTGVTTLSAGTTNITGSIGNTAVSVAAPATLSLQAAGAISQNTVTVNGTLTQTVDNALSGTAALVLNSGATLANANTFSGGTTLNTGTLNLNHATSIGTGTLTLNGGTINNTNGGVTLTNNNAEAWTNNASVASTGTNAINLGTGAVTFGADAATASFTLTNNSGLGGTSLTVGGAITPGTGGVPGTKTLNIAGAGSTALTGSVTKGTATALILNDTSPGTLTLSGSASSITTLNVNGGASSIVDIGAGSLTLSNGGNSILQSTTGGTVNGSGSAAIALGSNTGDLGTAGGTTLTINAKISGANGVDFFNNNGGAGFGTVILAGANTWTGSTNIENEKIILTGNINAANTANIGQISVGDFASTNALLVISGGTVNATKTASPSFAIGSVANAIGAVNMTSGSLTTTSELHIGRGAGAYAALTVSGGTVTSGSWLVVGLNNDRAVLNQSGGTIGVSANRMTVGAGGTGSIGLANLSGGTFTSAGGVFIGENGNGTLNLSGSSVMTLGANGLNIGNVAGSVGAVNLNGGTINTAIVSKGSGTAGFNFNGGLLQANATTTTFMTGLTAAVVNSGGANIDTNTKDITIAQALLAPTGNGITNGGLTVSGSGYIDTPLVTVTGGGGTGASAVANIDGSGNLTGITITNPGIGYTSSPTFALVGGGGSGSISGTTTPVANVSGGLTKSGAGTLTLTGASTFSGNISVTGGTLAANLANNFLNPTSSALGNNQVARTITLSGSSTLKFNSGDTMGSSDSTILSTIVIGAGSTVTNSGNVFNRLGSVTLNGGTLTSTGGAITGYQAYSFDASAVVTVGGSTASTISSTGTFNGIHLNSKTTFNVANATGDSATDLTVSAPLINRNATEGGAGGLTKSGVGTMTLTGVNTYTGATTLSGGTLALSSTGSIDNTSGVALGTGGSTFDVSAKGGYTVASLTGSGTVVGALTVSTTLAIGNSPGTTSFGGDLTLGAASTDTYEVVGSSTVGGPYTAGTADLGIGAGNLTLSLGAILNLVELGTYTDGDKFTLFGYTGTESGTFKVGGVSINDDMTFSGPGGSWQIDYNDTSYGLNGVGSGTSFVTITAIPEPRAALLGGLGMLALCRRRRN